MAGNFQTQLAKLAMVQRERAKHLHMSLEEKVAKNLMKEKPIMLSEIATWGSMARTTNTDTIDTTFQSDGVLPADDLTSRVSLWRGDITTLAVGAICNAAKRSLLGGGNVDCSIGIMDTFFTLFSLGVDGSIHRGAGQHLYNECELLCGCNPGEAKMTGGYLLPAKYVIHTVGPHMHFDGGGGNQVSKRQLLANCYQNCLDLVLQHNTKQRQLQTQLHSIDAVTHTLNGVDIDKVKMDSVEGGESGAKVDQGADRPTSIQIEPCIEAIAFPCISTGSYGYPQEDAANIALSVCSEWLEKHPEELQRIIFCVFLESDYDIYMKLLPQYFPLETQIR